MTFAQRAWEKAAYDLARDYDGLHRVRIHYATGPDRGSFQVEADGAPRLRLDTRSEKPGYAVSEPFLARAFRVHGLQGACTLLGFDAERQPWRSGAPQLPGGALVHALGNSWGQARDAAGVEAEAWRAFSAAVRPDLFIVLFGTNDQHNDGVVRNYAEAQARLLATLRAAAPQASLLVLSCPEAGQTKDGLAAQYRAAAREAAAAGGAAFWDLGAVPGARSARWTREGLFGDGLHYDELGGSLIARLVLRQLGFDPSDPAHLRTCVADPPAEPPPALTIARLAAAPELDGVVAALAGQPPIAIHDRDAQLAEVRLAAAGDQLAVHAVIRDARCAGDPATWAEGGFDLYLADPEVLSDNRFAPGPLVRQVVIRNRPPAKGAQATLHQYDKPESEAPIRFRVQARRDGPGWEAVALIPCAPVGLQPGAPFLLELAAAGAVRAGAPPAFCRAFARSGDHGAFRDASQSARVTVR